MPTLRYAWRNLWRNKKRTTITLVAVALNTAILITFSALMDGLLNQAIGNATNLTVGEIQIHAPGYLEDHSIYKSLLAPEIILQAAKERKINAAPRSYGYGLVSHESKSAGALFWGVKPNLEREFFDLAGQIEKGDFLSDKPRRGIVLGKKLARSLNVIVGSEIVVVVQAADGSLGNDLYTVTGIFKTAGGNIDRSAAIIHIKDLRELFVLGERVHEIALNTRGELPLEKLAAFAEEAAQENEVKTWRELLPVFSDMVNLSDASLWIMGLIFFLSAGLGVMNSMLMATYERIHEFGILKALGTTPGRILRDVTAEALVLALLATTLGAIIGTAGSYYLQVVGLDTSAFAEGTSMGGVVFDPLWRATLSIQTVTWPVITMCIVCVGASLYPAAMAARLDPVQAMEHV